MGQIPREMIQIVIAVAAARFISNEVTPDFSHSAANGLQDSCSKGVVLDWAVFRCFCRFADEIRNLLFSLGTILRCESGLESLAVRFNSQHTFYIRQVHDQGKPSYGSSNKLTQFVNDSI